MSEYPRNLKEFFDQVKKLKIDTAQIEEYFESRLMSRIRMLEQRQGINNSLLFRLAWRMVPVFVSIGLLVFAGGLVLNAKSDIGYAMTTKEYIEVKLLHATLTGGYHE